MSKKYPNLPPWAGTKPIQQENETDTDFSTRLVDWRTRHSAFLKALNAARRSDPEHKAKAAVRAAQRHKERWETDPEYRKRKNAAVLKSMRKNRERHNATAARLHNKKYREDPYYRLECNVRNRLRDALRYQGVDKESKSWELIGCTSVELRSHIEAQFKPGMTWENYGEWVVDHILPVCSFDLTDLSQQVLCFGYRNLQPLWYQENLDKVVQDMELRFGK